MDYRQKYLGQGTILVYLVSKYISKANSLYNLKAIPTNRTFKMYFSAFGSKFIIIYHLKNFWLGQKQLSQDNCDISTLL